LKAPTNITPPFGNQQEVYHYLKKQGFMSKTVPFSRYEIIQILGWGKDIWNYHRVLESLERWTSITLKYENA
jgi:hypothetical protein